LIDKYGVASVGERLNAITHSHEREISGKELSVSIERE